MKPDELFIAKTNGKADFKIPAGKKLQPNQRYAIVPIPEDCKDSDARLNVTPPAEVGKDLIRQTVQLAFVTSRKNETQLPEEEKVEEDRAKKPSTKTAKRPTVSKKKGKTN